MGSEQSCCGKYVCCGRELDSVGLEEFLEQADTGDIVLFNQTTVRTLWWFTDSLVLSWDLNGNASPDPSGIM